MKPKERKTKPEKNPKNLKELDPEKRVVELQKRLLDANAPVLTDEPDELAELVGTKKPQVGGHKKGPTRTNKTLRFKNELLRALVKHRGVVSMACAETGITRTTFYAWCKTDSAFEEAAMGVKDVALDFAESRLFSAMGRNRAEGVTATIFYLKTQGKRRGYIERNELTGADGEPLGFSTAAAVAQKVAKMTPEQRAARLRELAKEKNESKTPRS
jgi:cyclophilin family peptidyl-prolyl cis-trans isomerase